MSHDTRLCSVDRAPFATHFCGALGGDLVIILCYVLLAWVGFATALFVCWVVLIEIEEWRQRREMRALTREYEQWERARQATGGQR